MIAELETSFRPTEAGTQTILTGMFSPATAIAVEALGVDASAINAATPAVDGSQRVTFEVVDPKSVPNGDTDFGPGTTAMVVNLPKGMSGPAFNRLVVSTGRKLAEATNTNPLAIAYRDALAREQTFLAEAGQAATAAPRDRRRHVAA